MAFAPGEKIILAANEIDGLLLRSGWVRIADIGVQTTGAISAKVFQDPGGDSILQSCTSSTTDISVAVESSFPKVTVNGTPQTLTRVGDIYSGDVDITLAVSGTVTAQVITADDNAGPTDSADVTLDLPPEVLTLSFTGGYPGSQTELKAGDTFQITGTTDKTADAIDILDFGAFSASLEAFAAGTSFTVTGTIANRGTTVQALAGRVRARNPAGAFGGTRDTNELGGTTDGVDLVNLNNLYPSVSFGAITYPLTQQALKASETADVVNSVTDADVVLYDSPNGDLSIASPTVIATPKTVTRIAGIYNVSTPNLRVTGTRNANDAVSVATTTVNIASVALSLTVSTPAARLRSGGNDGTTIQNHTITVTGDQQLLAAPSLTEGTGSAGTFIGSWAGGGTTWTRTLQVHDNDDKGTKTWQSPSATNLAGIVTTTIAVGPTYELGGFVARTLTFGAFLQTTALNVAVTTYTKVSAGIFTATNQPALRNPVQGDTSDIANTYTIQSPLGVNPQTLFWNDQAAAGSNSGGTAQITNVQEAV